MRCIYCTVEHREDCKEWCTYSKSYRTTSSVVQYVCVYLSAIVNLFLFWGIRLNASEKESFCMARSLHYEKWGYCTEAKPCWMIKRLTPIWVFITALDGESGFSYSCKTLRMTNLLVMHRLSLIQPSLHVCACTVSFQCRILCVLLPCWIFRWAHSWIFRIHVSDLHACRFVHIWS